MPDCTYCEDSFDDEQAYLQHLADEHEGELGTIDQRRVEEELDGDDEFEIPTGPLVLGIVLGIAVLIVVYVVFFFGSGDASPAPGSNSGSVAGADAASTANITQTPGPVRSAHEHGTIEVSIDGQQLDFSQPGYQQLADRFHFENQNGRIWHTHATGVTLEWAMATLDIGVSEDTVVFDGTVYRDSDPGTDVTVAVNGEPVDPQTYVLEGESDANARQGDHVRIAVETNQSG